jgi:hypothetical protein
MRRERFRPKQTRVLLIGESRPANGTFFYCRNSDLVRYTRDAFEIQYGAFCDMEAFLRCFQSMGCYLIDLCPVPVNRLPTPERKRERRNAEQMLSSALAELKARAFIVVMKAIAPSVSRAAATANVELTPCDVLPFPAHGNQRAYVKGLSLVLGRLKAERVLPEAC